MKDTSSEQKQSVC